MSESPRNISSATAMTLQDYMLLHQARKQVRQRRRKSQSKGEEITFAHHEQMRQRGVFIVLEDIVRQSKITIAEKLTDHEGSPDQLFGLISRQLDKLTEQIKAQVRVLVRDAFMHYQFQGEALNVKPIPQNQEYLKQMVEATSHKRAPTTSNVAKQTFKQKQNTQNIVNLILGQVKTAIPSKPVKRSMSGGNEPKERQEQSINRNEGKSKNVTFSEPKRQTQPVKAQPNQEGTGGFNIFAALLGGAPPSPAPATPEPAKQSGVSQKASLVGSNENGKKGRPPAPPQATPPPSKERIGLLRRSPAVHTRPPSTHKKPAVNERGTSP